MQRGPSFKQPMETSIDASSGEVTVRYKDQDGGEKVLKERRDLPPDIANGLLFTLVKHIQPSVPQTTVSMVATTPKPRLVKLEILPEGEKAIASGNTKHETVRYVVKVKIGGVFRQKTSDLSKPRKIIGNVRIELRQRNKVLYFCAAIYHIREIGERIMVFHIGIRIVPRVPTIRNALGI